ncbi:hypothetical protein SBADM41S_02993 [Streptomyces badius]
MQQLARCLDLSRAPRIGLSLQLAETLTTTWAPCRSAASSRACAGFLVEHLHRGRYAILGGRERVLQAGAGGLPDRVVVAAVLRAVASWPPGPARRAASRSWRWSAAGLGMWTRRVWEGPHYTGAARAVFVHHTGSPTTTAILRGRPRADPGRPARPHPAGRLGRQDPRQLPRRPLRHHLRGPGRGRRPLGARRGHQGVQRRHGRHRGDRELRPGGGGAEADDGRAGEARRVEAGGPADRWAGSTWSRRTTRAASTRARWPTCTSIPGHRDSFETRCPGDALYAMLPNCWSAPRSCAPPSPATRRRPGCARRSDPRAAKGYRADGFARGWPGPRICRRPW